MSIDQLIIANGAARFLPIADNGVLSDCEANCLVAQASSHFVLIHALGCLVEVEPAPFARSLAS